MGLQTELSAKWCFELGTQPGSASVRLGFGALKATVPLLAKHECQTEKTSLHRVHTASACAGERLGNLSKHDGDG